MNAAMTNNNIRILAGNSNPELVSKICEQLSLPLGEALVTTFSDGEIRVEVSENVRGRDIFIIQSICPPRQPQPDGAADYDRRGETGLGP